MPSHSRRFRANHLAATALLLGLSAAYAQEPAAPVGSTDLNRQESAQPESAAQADPAPTKATDAGSADHPGIRIVRLSQVKGTVALARSAEHTGTDEAATQFEPAFDNLPLIQGAQLRTGEGVAEVEFEDNTTLRLAPNTLVRFVSLRRAPDGSTTSVIDVVHGMVYAARLKPQNKLAGGTFALTFASDRALLEPGGHVRLQVAAPLTHLSVLDGNVSVESPQGTQLIAKKHGLLLDADHPETATLTDKEMDPSEFDAWDKQSASYHQNLSNVSAYAGTGGLYGLNDMAYYGSFVNMGSCGSLWQPYFVSANWSPYSYGAYAYYPGAGYSFVSPYPWGWTPFHSGAWQQCGSSGWGWRPSGAGFVGLGNTGLLSAAAIKPPSLPPHRGQVGIVPIARPPAVSTMTSEGEFVFHRDSAGLGVPRQSFGKLADTSKLVARHGTASVALEAPEFRTGAAGLQHGALAESLRPTPASGVAPGPHPVTNTGFAAPTSNMRVNNTSAGSNTSAASAGHGSAAGGGGASRR